MTELVEVKMDATHAQLAEIISLRDYFAMATLPSLIGALSEFTNRPAPTEEGQIAALAEVAYKYANAMLAEKAKHET